MGELTQKLYEADYAGRIFTERQLAHIFFGGVTRVATDWSIEP
jgi:hypothetical protein